MQHSPLKTRLKGDGSAVSEADLHANLVLCEFLSRFAPGVPVLSEEEPPFSGAETFIALDPLDGTEAYLKKLPDYSINIALIHQQKIEWGILYLPTSDKIYYAERTKGAYEWMDSSPALLKTQQKSIPTVLLSRRSKAHSKIKKAFPECMIEGISGAQKFSMIAEGRAQIYFRDQPSYIWDTAAGEILVTEAGGAITPALSTEWNENGNPNFVVVSHPSLLRDVKQML